MTEQVVAVLGRGVVPRDTPLLVADDLGLTRGDGCFDACRVVVSDISGVQLELNQRHMSDAGLSDRVETWRRLDVCRVRPSIWGNFRRRLSTILV